MRSAGSRLVNLTIVRYGLVSLVNEGLYFFLYWVGYTLTRSTTATLAIAGAICILVNGYSHARITFRVRFNWRLLLGYLQIQIVCFALSFLFGILAKRAGASEAVIAFLTYTFWAFFSFFLTRHLFRTPRSEKHFLHSLLAKAKPSSSMRSRQ